MRERRAPKADARDTEQVLALFERTARARQLYASNHTTIKRMKGELIAAFDRLLSNRTELSLKVRADAFILDEDRVLEQPNPDESLPFLFYRDGVRRLDFHRGLDAKELDVLLDATAEARRFNSLGDDIVAYLWRHDLEHVRYVVVDTTIVERKDTDPTAASPRDDEHDIDNQIDGLLRSIYGNTSDDVGPRSVHVDASDIPAKAIADQLDAIDEMAPGFHPPRAFVHAAVYAPELLEEEAASDKQLAGRMARRTIQAWAEAGGFLESSTFADALLRVYDGAIVDGSIDLARFIMAAVRSVVPPSSQLDAWLDDALAESRLRQVVAQYARVAVPRAGETAIAFFRACGEEAVGTLLRLVPSIPSPELRRAYANALVEVGIKDIAPVEALVASEQAFVALEGVHILSVVDTPGARLALINAARHEHAQVRLVVVTLAVAFPEARRQALATQMLEDEDLRVRVEASNLLRTVANKETALVAKRCVNRMAFLDEPYALQATFLETFAILNQVWSLRLLTKYVTRATGMLSKKSSELLAVAAIRAMRHVPTPRTYDCLEKASTSRHKRIRDAATATITEMGPRP